MSDKKEEKNIDAIELYDSLLEIMEFENEFKRKLANDKRKTQEEKENIESSFKEKKEAIEKKREIFLKSIEGRDVRQLQEIVMVMQKIYVEQRDLKPQVKKLLTEVSFRKQIHALRKQDFKRAYLMIEFISSKFPVDDYPMYTLKPDAVLYGSEIVKTTKESIYLSPLNNDEIMDCLEVFSEKNKWTFYNWVMAILAFDSEKMVEAFKEKYLKERKELLLKVIERIKKNSLFKTVIMDKLLEKGDLARIINLQVAGSNAEKKVKELEEKINEMTASVEEEKKSYQERAKKQENIIIEKKEELAQMRKELKKFDDMSSKLSEFMRRYDAQVKANDMLVIGYEKRIFDIEEKNKNYLEDNQRLRVEVMELSNEFENVKSDLSLKIAEIARITESVGETEKKERERVLSELVADMKEQIYYILLFYEELVENGTLENESIEMFGNTIQNIKKSLKELGVVMYGKIDESVEYDSALHDSMGCKISNGEKVIIRVPGWKINGMVYSKAQVEKES